MQGEDDLTRTTRIGYYLDRNLLLRVALSENRHRSIIVDDSENTSTQRHAEISLRYLRAFANTRWFAMEGSVLRQNPDVETGAGSEIKLTGTYYFSTLQGLTLGVARTTENTEHGRGAIVDAAYEIFVTSRLSLRAYYRTFRPAGEGDTVNTEWWGLGINGRF